MYGAYIDHRWQILQECELLASEQPFAVPMPHTEDVWYVGRLDKVIDFASQRLIIEHKTTTEYKKDGHFKIDYVEGWFSDSQVKGYQFGGGMFFEGTSAVWVDAALVHKSVHNGFRFIPVAHQFGLLDEWLTDTLEWIRRIEADTDRYQSEGKLTQGTFPKNEGSCYGKFGRCPFLDICRTTADPSQISEPPPGFKLDRWEPFDVLGLDKLIKEPSHV